jgi:pyruvoyl-dependent arginine decarboxylase (PvlArgDC)
MNRADFENELKQRAIRLLLCRAGGRYTMFEAGQLYQTCLLLGMPDSRHGAIGEQEKNWEAFVSSCMDEKAAKNMLKSLLSLGKNQTNSQSLKTEVE